MTRLVQSFSVPHAPESLSRYDDCFSSLRGVCSVPVRFTTHERYPPSPNPNTCRRSFPETNPKGRSFRARTRLWVRYGPRARQRTRLGGWQARPGARRRKRRAFVPHVVHFRFQTTGTFSAFNTVQPLVEEILRQFGNSKRANATNQVGAAAFAPACHEHWQDQPPEIPNSPRCDR